MDERTLGKFLRVLILLKCLDFGKQKRFSSLLADVVVGLLLSSKKETEEIFRREIEEMYFRLLAGGIGMSLTKTISTWPSTSNPRRLNMLLKMVCRCCSGI